MPGRYYRSLDNLHVNTEAPRAYFIPFESEEKLAQPREKSEYFTLLSGEWDFAYFENVEELDIEDENFPGSVLCPDSMRVPMCWQLVRDKGYDVPNYINQDYPFPVDPPHLPDVIPCGFYRRRKTVIKNGNKSYFINFEGVSSGFYLWVNGRFAGYSQVSHCTSEFEITEFLTDGDNLFEVLVVKHCTGSYMEDQDFFRLSGIFRDVYILERSADPIRDIRISAVPDLTDNTAEITIETKSAAPVSFRWKLLSPDGSVVSEGKAVKEISFPVNDPALWSPEVPQLYKLILSTDEEYFSFEVGIREICIRIGCLLLNGQKIKLRGINRHDSNPETGYAVTESDMLNDLYILKRANVNTIRTSHYPNDPRFPEMCDRLGFMLIDEADLESHGMGYNYGDWYWDYWAYLCDAPEWEEACLDRAERLYERDKNHACVIMWSLGNESGCGENHRKMANLIRARDPRAIIHYENARLEYAERLGKDFSDISDVESRMYASLDYLQEYLNDPAMTKPFFYCEYVAAWSTGDIPLHWDGFEEYDNYCGGCVWEFTDHAVNVGTKKEPKFRYGGDFGDYPNDFIYCVDGIVYPDRRLRPGYYDMKECYKPFVITYNDGTVTLKNKNCFTSLDTLAFRWTAEHNGRIVASGELDTDGIAPLETRNFPLQIPAVECGLLTLDFRCTLKEPTVWAEAGYELGHRQFILLDEPLPTESSSALHPDITEDRKSVRIQSGNTVFLFDKLNGRIASVEKDGKQYLASPAAFTLFRSFHPANGTQSQWKRARYDHAYQKTYNCTVTTETDGTAVITSDLSFAAQAMPPAVRCTAEYRFRGDGSFILTVRADVTDNAPALPRFGIELVMPEEFENMEYLGYGPYETYPDRYKSTMISRYKTTASENFEHYIMPTECSAHYRTKEAYITNNDGKGLKITDTDVKGFSFNALHYGDKKLFETMHDDELTADRETTVHIDYKLHSDNPGFADTEPDRAFTEKHFEFSYVFTVL